MTARYRDFDPELWAKALVQRLTEVESRSPNIRGLSVDMVDMARQQLSENAGTLFRALVQLPDRDREQARRSLYFVLSAVFEIGRGQIPLDSAMHLFDEMRPHFAAADMRLSKRKIGAQRNAIIDEVVDGEQKKNSRLPAAKVVHRIANERLKAAGLSETTIKKVRGNISRIKSSLSSKER